jgi:predicted enzyme related to lactoylglutathione lyase
MGISGIGALTLYANEPGILAAWYTNTLGFSFQQDPTDHSHFGEITDSETGESVFMAILPAKGELPYGNRGARVTYKVKRFPEFVGSLERRGVKIESRRGAGKSLFVTLSDPEGNEIELWSGA